MLSDYDGERYRHLSFPKSDPHNLSYIFNSDGSPVFNSSKSSIWLIHVMINELPPDLRLKNIMLAGLWFGPKEPVMEIFLKSFVDQAKTPADTGVTWHQEGSVINSKRVGLCCSVDCKARSLIQNTTQFNGYYDCGFWEAG